MPFNVVPRVFRVSQTDSKYSQFFSLRRFAVPVMAAVKLTFATAAFASATLDNSGTMRLMPVPANVANIPGTRVKDFIETAGNRLTVSGSGTSKGIAVTGVDNSNGTWQYTLDGSTWQTFASPSASAALLLKADTNTRVRFVANLNYSGVVSLNFKAWDSTGASEGATADTTTGDAAFSTAAGSASVRVGSVWDSSQAPSAETKFNVASGNINNSSVIQLANGNFLAIWKMSTDTVGYYRITIRKPDLTLVSETSTNYFRGVNPAVTPIPLLGGGFAIIFADGSTGAGALDPDGSMGVRARIYDDTGNITSAAEIVVNTTTAGSQFSATGAALANGGFMACYIDQSSGQIGRIRRFDASGNALDAQDISVAAQGTDAPNLGVSGSVQTPRVALLADGSVAVSYWVNTINQMYVLRMDADGNILDKPGGSPGQKQIQVSTDISTGAFVSQAVPLTSGGFLVFYQSQNGSTAARAESYRLFDSGFNQGPVVNVETVGNTNPYPGSAPLTTGGFVLARTSGSPVNQISFGIYDNTGSGPAVPSGLTAVVLNSTANYALGAVVPMNDGGFAFKWHSGATTTTRDLYVKVFPNHTQVATAAVASINRAASSPTSATAVSWTVTFSGAVSGLTAGNFSLTGTAASGATIGTPTGSGTTWTVPVTATTDGTLQLNLANASGLTPTISNPSFAGQSYTIDTTAPMITVGAPSSIITGSGSVSYSVSYADANFASSSLSATDITLDTTGTASGTVDVTGSGTAYTVTISGITGDGTLGFTIASGTALDTVGNTAASAASASFTVDHTAPTVSVGGPSQALTAGGPVTYTVTYADANFAASSLSAANVTLNTTGDATGTLDVSGSGTTYTVTISGITGNGTIGFSIAAGTATDSVGNSAAASGASATFTVDNSGPLISVSAPSSQLTTSNSVTFTVTYDDVNFSASTLSTADVSLQTTGTAAGTVSVSGTGASRLVSIDNPSGDGTIRISIAAGTASDLVGNLAPASGPSLSFIVANSPITLSLTNTPDGNTVGGLTGIPDMTYRIQSCTNLLDPVWELETSLTTDNLGTGSFPVTNMVDMKFFRAVLP